MGTRCKNWRCPEIGDRSGIWSVSGTAACEEEEEVEAGETAASHPGARPGGAGHRLSLPQTPATDSLRTAKSNYSFFFRHKK